MILSFDPGVKNCGIFVGLVKGADIIPVLANVVDLYEGKKAMPEIAASLNKTLSSLDKTLADNKIIITDVLVEVQDGKRSCINYGIMMQLLYHYTAKGIRCHGMSAKLKNTICLDPALNLNDFKKRYKNPYDAYKSYAKENGKKYFAKYPTMVGALPQDKLHHLADAILQTYAYMKQKNK